MIKFQLGLPLVDQSAPADRLCPFCLCRMDPFGDHVLTCSAGNLYGRHNQFRDGLSVLLQDSSYVVRSEITVPNSPEALRPADLLVVNTSVGSPIALDVSLVHPLQSSLPQAAALPGTLAHHRAQQKVERYRAACKTAGWRFCPAVYETTGGHNPSFGPFLKQWARKMSMAAGCSVPDCLRAISWALSVLRGRCIAQHLTRAFPRSAASLSTLASSAALHSLPSSLQEPIPTNLPPAVGVLTKLDKTPPAAVVFVHQPYGPGRPESASLDIVGETDPAEEQPISTDLGRRGPAAGDLVLAQGLCC